MNRLALPGDVARQADIDRKQASHHVRPIRTPGAVLNLDQGDHNDRDQGSHRNYSAHCLSPLARARQPAGRVWPARRSQSNVRQLLGDDVDDRLGEGLRRFLRQVVADAALDGPVRIPAGEFPGVGGGLRMRRAVGVAFHRDGGHGDDRALRRAAFRGRRISLRPRRGRAASDNCGSRSRRDPDCRTPAALRSNVASSKFHFGEASCQISLANSCRYLS